MKKKKLIKILLVLFTTLSVNTRCFPGDLTRLFWLSSAVIIPEARAGPDVGGGDGEGAGGQVIKCETMFVEAAPRVFGAATLADGSG